MSKRTARGMGRGLGKGLGSLLGEEAIEAVVHEDMKSENEDDSDKPKIRLLRIIDIEPNLSQPRSSFDEEKLAELADSIERHGVIQPITVRQLENGAYQIIAGERRWRAARKAGLKEMPAIIMEADDLRSAELAMIENLQREDLNPIEEAEGYRTLMTTYDLTQEEVAERVGKSRPTVANAVRLLSLDSYVIDLLRNGSLSTGHARALLTLPADYQKLVADRIISQKMSVRQVEALVKKLQNDINQDQMGEKDQQKEIAVDYIDVLQRELGENLGRKVKIVNGKKKGRIEIEYYGNDDLNQLVEFLSSLKN
ncbi:MAG: ParB/RepB/Spo0J family partition protein [Eubacteriales bacterium]